MDTSEVNVETQNWNKQDERVIRFTKTYREDTRKITEEKEEETIK